MLEELELVRAAVRGETAAVNALVHRLTPVIHDSVARTLLERTWARRRDLHQQVEDLVQDVFLSLFDARGKVLLSWDPERGRSLPSFVSLVARRQVISVLRIGKTSPFTEDPTEDVEMTRLVDRAPEDLEARLGWREVLDEVLDRLQLEVSMRGLDVFQRLFVDHEAVEAVSAATGLSADAVYQWRSRLSTRVRKIATEVLADRPLSDSAPSSRKATGGTS